MSERIKFTHKGIASVQPRAKRFVVWDEDHRGLGLRVTPRGSKTYVLAYRFDGKSRLHTIGDTEGVSLREAFIEHAEAYAKIGRAKLARQRGEAPLPEHDPAGAKRRAKAATRAAETVKDLWDAYLVKRRPNLRERTIAEYTRMMDNDVLPHMGKSKARDVKPKDVKVLLNKIEMRGIVIANRTRALLAAVFAYAVDELVIDTNPVKLVRTIKGEMPRQRALADEAEIRGFFTALGEVALAPPVKRALQMILATGVRPGEAMHMRWSDVDRNANTWTIPAEFVKGKRNHVVPLSPIAVELLEESEAAGVLGEWVFPGLSGESRLPIPALSQAIATASDVFLRHEVATFRPHDLRRTCRTWLAKLKVPEAVAERVIGHMPKDRLVVTYDTHDYLPEKRAALELWSASLVAMRAGENVVAIGKAA